MFCCFLSDADSCLAHHTTDGTDEYDSEPRHFATKSYPMMPTRTTTSSHACTLSIDSTAYDKPHHPAPAFLYGGDGNRSDNSLDHPNNRPRAHHSRSSRRSSHSHYEMQPSEHSYRSGPDTESSRSGS